MKILFTASGRVGGATLAMLHLMLGLPHTGVKPILITPNPSAIDKNLLNKLKAKKVEVIGENPRVRGALHWMWLFFKTLKTARKQGIHIIHSHGPKEAAVTGVVAKILGIKHVYTVEGDPVLETHLNKNSLLSRLVNTVLFRLGLQLADEVVGCSQWMAAHLRETHGVKATPIWNPIDHERFSKTEQKPPREPTILTTARLDRVKDIETLIKAIANIDKQSRPNLLVAGDGPLRQSYTQLVKKLGLENNIQFLGHRSDVEKLLAKAHIFILPSIYEPFGMAAAEAMAAGRPVIASNVGGLREIVDHGVNGLLFTPRSHHELAQHITKLLTDKELWTRMSQNAATKSALFKPEEIAEQYKEVYRKCLA